MARNRRWGVEVKGIAGAIVLLAVVVAIIGWRAATHHRTDVYHHSDQTGFLPITKQSHR
jgi:hypothetical protein